MEPVRILKIEDFVDKTKKNGSYCKYDDTNNLDQRKYSHTKKAKP